MNTHDIELPPLPELKGGWTEYWTKYAHEKMQDYARAAIEADRKRRGEPVDIRQEVIETLEMILAADWRKWEELASPDEFVRWAKSRANYALSIINEAPQPAEPVKVPSDADIRRLAESIGAEGPELSGDAVDEFARALLDRYGSKS